MVVLLAEATIGSETELVLANKVDGDCDYPLIDSLTITIIVITHYCVRVIFSQF